MPGIGYSLLDQPVADNQATPAKVRVAGGEQILSILERENHLVERIRLISKVIRVNRHSESNKYLIKYCGVFCRFVGRYLGCGRARRERIHS